ncbi:long-chain fatty acid--CoA ligase [Arenicella sp. 4NH20-0111]|uniref:acyl-CoA synthetase n=1 Tax=Arenicella sp. 4NH20-0111 TaxID=3127648 RepID=UPI0031027489
MASVKPEYNLAHTLLRRAELNPERDALEFEGRVWTYGEFSERVRKAATVLKEKGVCRGDRVGFLGLNQPSFLETIFAANTIGAIFVPLNFRLTAEELGFIINDAGIHTLVVDEMLQPVVEGARDSLCCRNFLSVSQSAESWVNFDECINDAVVIDEMVTVSEDDICLIMYTSGTTGLPKGAMLSHGNIMWNNINSQLAFGGSRDDVLLTVAPLFHIGGLNVLSLQNFSIGSKLVLMRAFDPEAVLNAISEKSVTHMFGAPAMFQFMMQHPNFEKTNFESVSTFICGAAPPPESLLTTYAERGVPFCQGYGLTETSPFGTFLTPEWSISKLGSAGQAPMHTYVRVVNDDNKPVAANERGEICIMGANVMKGYWNRPEATASAIDDEGWFHSGDVGYLDDDGFLYICDRLKDMVISGGENVYPAEVESVLFKHEKIAEVAVIGLEDEKWGEAVTAVVALHEGQDLTLDELRSFAENQLAKYKLPLRLHIVDELPRNPAGKVLKFKLKEELA